MSQSTKLTPSEQKALRRGVKTIDENTWEVREHPYVFIKIIVIFLLACWFVGVSIAEHGGFKEAVIGNIENAFFQKHKFEKSFFQYEDKNNIGYSKEGENKLDYIQGMLDFHKGNRIASRIIFSFFALLFLYVLWPTKRRLRIDKKRQIAYTYLGKQLYVTELKKLSVPLVYYFGSNLVNHYLSVWVHPYRNTKGKKNRTMITVSPASTFFISIEIMKFVSSKSTTSAQNIVDVALPNSILPRSLIEFVNPDTDPAHIAELEKIINTPRSWTERLYDGVFNWMSAGLYCRAFPKPEKVESDLANYFEHIAPTIKQHPFYELKDLPFFVRNDAGLPYAHRDEKIDCDFYHAFTREEVQEQLQSYFDRVLKPKKKSK